VYEIRNETAIVYARFSLKCMFYLLKDVLCRTPQFAFMYNIHN